MIGAAKEQLKTQGLFRVNMKDFLDIVLYNNGKVRTSKSRRVQKFCEKYQLSQAEYEVVKDKIETSSFQVIG